MRERERDGYGAAYGNGPNDLDAPKPECRDAVRVRLDPHSGAPGEVADATKEKKCNKSRADQQRKGEDVFGNGTPLALRSQRIVNLRSHARGVDVERHLAPGRDCVVFSERDNRSPTHEYDGGPGLFLYRCSPLTRVIEHALERSACSLRALLDAVPSAGDTE